MELAANILERVEVAFRTCGTVYRDSMLECGRLIHEYIVAYLAEADGKNTSRERDSFKRQDPIRNCAAKLDISISQVGRLVRAAMVVSLFGHPGKLPWDIVYTFGRFIHRKSNDKNRARGSNGISRSLFEEWEIRPESEEEAKGLYEQATTGGLKRAEQKSLRRVRTKSNNQGGKTRREEDDPVCSVKSLKSMAKVAGARDIAESLYEIVKEADDPLAVVEHLRTMIQDAKKKRRHELYGVT